MEIDEENANIFSQHIPDFFPGFIATSKWTCYLLYASLSPTTIRFGFVSLLARERERESTRERNYHFLSQSLSQDRLEAVEVCGRSVEGMRFICKYWII